MMVDRETARHKAPSRRVPRSVLTVALLAAAVFGVAAVYLVIPKSSGGRSAATAPVPGVTSISAAKVGTTTTGPLPGSPAKQGIAASASPPQTGPKPLQPSDPGAVSSWSTKAGKALAHVTTQSENVVSARTAGNYPRMLRYCTALAAAVQDAKNAPAIPDAAMQQMYTQSLRRRARRGRCQRSPATHRSPTAGQAQQPSVSCPATVPKELTEFRAPPERYDPGLGAQQPG